MSSSHKLVPLKILRTANESRYLYFPAEKNEKGKLVRQLMVFKKSEFDIAHDNGIKPSDSETIKCYIRDNLRINDLVEEAKKLMIYLKKDDDPQRKVNRVTIAWASKGWLFDDKGNRISPFPPASPEQSKDKRLPSSLPASSEQLGINTDEPKNPKEKKKLFGHTLKISDIQRAKLDAENRDSKRVSDLLPTSSKSTNADGRSKQKRNMPFQEESDNERSGDLFVSEGEDTNWKSAADDEKKKAGRERERVAEGKKPIRNEASNNAKGGKSVSTSSKPTGAWIPKRGSSKVSDSESDPDPNSLFIPERTSAHPKSAADDKTKKTALEMELFLPNEDDNSASLKPHHKTKTTGGKTVEPIKPAKKTKTNTDLAGDKPIRRDGRERPNSEKVSTTGESIRRTARTRDDRSKSPNRASRKPEIQRQRGESVRTSSREPAGVAVRKVVTVKKESTSAGKSSSSRARTGNELASTAGLYYESKGVYTKGRRTWYTEEIDPNRPPTEKELRDKELEDARRTWKKKHGTEL